MAPAILSASASACRHSRDAHAQGGSEGPGRVAQALSNFDRVSVGFPGVIKNGITYTAANLHPGWYNFPLRQNCRNDGRNPCAWPMTPPYRAMVPSRATAWKCSLPLAPGWVRHSSLMAAYAPDLNSAIIPGKETAIRGLSRPPRPRQIRQKALEQVARGSHRADRQLFNWDHLYLGGGNTKKITFKPGKNIEIVSNETGLLGGVALWREWD